MRISDLDGKRIALWGWGREGRAAHAALRARLPSQPMTVLCTDSEADLVAGIGDPRVQVATAVDADVLAAFEVVVKSPGISPYRADVETATARGTAFTSGTALWFAERSDACVLAVTGTKGKSTTAAMAAHMARALGVRTALAGNIGLPLLELLDGQAELWVVELSSFQTDQAGPVAVAAITNLYEEHLDWHGSRERYMADKLRLADVARTLVVPASQPELLARTATHPHRILFGAADGWHVRDGDLCRGEVIVDPSLVAIGHLPGEHNALNACAAITALELSLDLPQDAIADGVESLVDFAPLPHRLQTLGEREGLTWINDSISTTPEATMVGRASLRQPMVTVILGGHDRGLDWSKFTAFATDWPAMRIITQGGNGPRIATLLRDAKYPSELLHEAADLAEAVAVARRITARSEAVLLSPGAPSFDQFRDYTARGREFARLAGFDPSVIARIEGMGIA